MNDGRHAYHGPGHKDMQRLPMAPVANSKGRQWLAIS